jgi:hypothetical protein
MFPNIDVFNTCRNTTWFQSWNTVDITSLRCFSVYLTLRWGRVLVIELTANHDINSSWLPSPAPLLLDNVEIRINKNHEYAIYMVLSNKRSTPSFEVLMLYLFTFRWHARPYLYFLRNVGSVADTMKRLTDMHVINLKKPCVFVNNKFWFIDTRKHICYIFT